MGSIIPYIPETITVHLGLPAQDVPNVTLPFSDYIKNVASSEVYPTWEPCAIRANILAQVSFALNRVYTEYYPARGYDFNITSTTQYDQRFVNGRTIFENVAQLVDSLFNTYIRRQGYLEPLLASFCNGTTVTCAGMSQWGSQELAQQGRSALEILRTYYGEDIELVTGAPVQGIRTSYPGTPLVQGDLNRSVRWVQVMLNRISRNYPSIPVVSVDSIFGPRTQEAVIRFQEIFDLEPDGVVGSATWYAMVRLYVAVTGLAELYSQGQTLTGTSFSYPVRLSPGSEGGKVEQLRYMLAVIGRFIDVLSPIGVGTVYDGDTVQAVTAFQQYAGLPETGAVDIDTWDAIFSYYDGIRTLFPQEDLEADTSLRYPGEPLDAGPGQ